MTTGRPVAARAPRRPLGVARVAGSTCATMVALATLMASWASAHVGHQVQTAERYIKIDVSGNTGRVVVSLNTGATETLRLMRLADIDGDQTVTDDERNAYLAEWRTGLTQEVQLHAGDIAVPLEWGEAFMSPTGPLQAASGSVEMVGSFSFAGGEVTFTLTDNMPQGGFERTDYSARVRDGATLIGAGLGRIEASRDRFALRRGTRVPGPFMVQVNAPLTSVAASDTSLPTLSGQQTAALVLVLLVSGVALSSLRRPSNGASKEA